MADSDDDKYYDNQDNYLSSDDDDDELSDLLRKKLARNKTYETDSEDEVYNVDPDEDENGQSDVADSDIEGQEEDDDLPDVRAWGKDKKSFYSTDYVDPDFGGFQGKDAQLAELEEEEAKNLQRQLAQQLDDSDFSFSAFIQKNEEEEKKDVEEVVKKDISSLSRRQKLQILERESPEFYGLVNDAKEKLEVFKEFLHPFMEKHAKGEITDCNAAKFVTTYHQTVLTYITNIYMYLLLKSTGTNIKNHPVSKKIYQFKQLLLQMEPVFEEIVKPQLEILLKVEQDEDSVEKTVSKKKPLKMLSQLIQKEKETVAAKEEEKRLKKITEDKKKKATEVLDVDVPKKKVKLDDSDESSEESVEEEEDGVQQDVNMENGQDTESSRRAINYQISKNKGLTAYKKKELRNPRVKHRLKFRKALIRRKGAVRTPRTELTRYAGELSGINASVVKSVKIKV